MKVAMTAGGVPVSPNIGVSPSGRMFMLGAEALGFLCAAGFLATRFFEARRGSKSDLSPETELARQPQYGGADGQRPRF